MRGTRIATAIVALGPVFFCATLLAEVPTNDAALRAGTVPVTVTVNSESLGKEGFRAMDGDPTTVWRTPWHEKDKRRHPHEIIVDLGQSSEITGFTYQPPRGGGNGSIKDYEFFVSDDEKNFGGPINKGTFADSDREKKVALEESKQGRYVKLVSRSEVYGQPWASIAELTIHSPGVRFIAAPYGPEKMAELEEMDRRGVRPPQDNAQELLDLAMRTLEFVEQTAPQPKLAAELKKLEKDAAARGNDGGYRDQLRQVRRKIILAHPALNFSKILINKRPPPGYSHMCDQYLGRHSRPGPGLCVLENWKDKPAAKVLLAGKLPEGSMLHPDLSYDAKRVLFSFCDHTEKDTKGRRFLIYEVGIDGNNLRQLTGTPADPMEGWQGRETVLIEDFDPVYLPDGGFAFMSTRCQTFGRCHGSRYVPVYMLHRANGDGSGIRQLSFGEANEWDPAVMNNGRIVYSRWDYINRHDVRFQSLWAIAPDGTSTTDFYGNYSPSPCMETEPRAIPGSHKIVSTTAAHHSYTAGSIIVIDPHKGQDGLKPLKRITPEISFPEAGDKYGGGARGAFATPCPLSEDLFLMAYTSENRCGQGGVQAVNAYGIYLVDSLGGRELIYRDPQMSCFAPLPIQPRQTPPVVASEIAGREEMKYGVFYVQDICKSDQPIEPGSIKGVRINQIYGQPNNGKPQLSLANNEIIKGIVGTVPVASDGSVAFRAPAGVPLQLQALDKDGMAVMTMRTVVYLQPGEISTCVGCHEKRNSTPIPMPLPRNVKIHDPTPPPGPQYCGGFSFARTVQPVLDRYCIECHGLKKKDADLDLLGVRENGYNRAHNQLTRRKGFVTIAYRNRESFFSTPKEYYANAGKLAKYLLEDHTKRVKLDRESFQRIVDWLDLNAQYYGNYSRNRVEDQRIDGEGEKLLREQIAKEFGPEMSKQPIEALVNVAQPSESRILKAPLSTSAGGWGQIAKNGWGSTNDPRYKEMLRLVEATIVPRETFDIAGTCGRERCGCGTCWTRHIRQARNNPPKDFGLKPFPNGKIEKDVVAIPKDTWKLVRADSEETTATDGAAANAFDGNQATYWHTQSYEVSPSHPHEIVIDIGTSYNVCGFEFSTRNGLGNIKDCEFYVGDSPSNFGEPAAKGTFTRHGKQTVTFDPKPGRFVRLRALSSLTGDPYTSLRELTVFSFEGSTEQVSAK